MGHSPGATTNDLVQAISIRRSHERLPTTPRDNSSGSEGPLPPIQGGAQDELPAGSGRPHARSEDAMLRSKGPASPTQVVARGEKIVAAKWGLPPLRGGGGGQTLAEQKRGYKYPP